MLLIRIMNMNIRMNINAKLCAGLVDVYGFSENEYRIFKVMSEYIPASRILLKFRKRRIVLEIVHRKRRLWRLRPRLVPDRTRFFRPLAK